MDNSLSRRWFLQQCRLGLGGIAATSLLSRASDANASSPVEQFDASPVARAKHTPKAKNVIFLFMGGAPSQLDLFDYKPNLIKRDGQMPPQSLLDGYRAAFINPSSKLMGSKYSFARHGQSGAEISELLPHTAKIADDIAIIRSVQTDAFNHAPAQILLSTGSERLGHPSVGAWTQYGLGRESEDLPGFTVMCSGKKGPSGGAACWSSGYLPSTHQGVRLRSTGDPLLYLSNPKGITPTTQRHAIDAINRLNRHRHRNVGDPDIDARIKSMEMAWRMQSSGPELSNINNESQQTLDAYGASATEPSFARNCLMARRMVERGVRFVQLFHEGWDQHSKLDTDLRLLCQQTDQAAAALVSDLKQRGMLDETLVIWGGEFGRTPMVQGVTEDGRDHHPRAFTMWMAGGGVKPGITHGTTDEFGFNAVDGNVEVRDLHATILHLLGLNHERLTFRFQGLDQKLTGVKPARIVDEIIA